MGGRTMGTHGSAPTVPQGAGVPRVGTRLHPVTQEVPWWHPPGRAKMGSYSNPCPSIRATPEGQDEATSLHILLSPPQPEATGTPVPAPAMLGTPAAAR